MGLFSFRTSDERIGALIDIGSGSVLVSIVRSTKAAHHPEIIWSKREYTPLRNSDTLTQSAKNVMTSLMNAIMLLDQEGRARLKEATKSSFIPEIQVTIAAPWSYTVTKNIGYQHEKEFTVSEELVEELLRTAHQKIAEEITRTESVNSLGLAVIARSVIGIRANGYTIRKAVDQKARTLQVIEANAVAQQYLIHAVTEVKEKLLKESNLSLTSFILPYYRVAKSMYPDLSEYCLIDITYEATELGVVREGMLTYTSHVPKGSISIARSLSTVLGVPLMEAHGYLQDLSINSKLEHFSEDKQQAAVQILQDYTASIIGLFKETGDALSIPKTILIHSDKATEPMFSKCIEEAARDITGSSHATISTTIDILRTRYDNADSAGVDSAGLIAAQYFHDNTYHQTKD